MKHPSIRQLYAYWNTQRRERAAPDRVDIEPCAIRKLLADTFILSFDALQGHPFRVAGTRVCAIFGRELKNEPYLGLWSAESTSLARELMAVLAEDTVGIVASAAGTDSDGRERDLELLLLPLRHRGCTNSRVLGALAPNGEWLGQSRLDRLMLHTHRYVGPEQLRLPTPRWSIPGGRRRHRFVVYDGGQA